MFYNVKLDDKYENKLKDSYWNTGHLFLGQEYLFLDFSNNIAIQISMVVTHDLTVDTHTLLPLPYKMILRKYDAHVL